MSDDEILLDHNFNYDSWEYFEGELEGLEKILKAVSSLIKNEISIEVFMRTYEYLKSELNNKVLFSCFTDEYLRLAGLNDEDIKNTK